MLTHTHAGLYATQPCVSLANVIYCWHLSPSTQRCLCSRLRAMARLRCPAPSLLETLDCVSCSFLPVITKSNVMLCRAASDGGSQGGVPDYPQRFPSSPATSDVRHRNFICCCLERLFPRDTAKDGQASSARPFRIILPYACAIFFNTS